MSKELFSIADQAIEIAKKKGAQEVAARVYRERSVEFEWRDGRPDKVKEATSRGLGLSLYVDGRYASVNTSDLRPEALDSFIGDSIAMTRSIAKDPFRSLADPKLYAGQAAVDLKLEDPAHAGVTPERRKEVSKEIEAAARGAKGAEAIISVTTGFYDSRTEFARVHSNGFRGLRVDTSFTAGASVSVKDPDGRKPEDYAYATRRFADELPKASELGVLGAARALGKIGAKKPESAVLPMAVDNRASGRLVGQLIGPMSGGNLQQKRSFLEGKLGQTIGSPLLTITDDPLVAKGLGSRLFDGEGIAAKPMPIWEAGTLKAYYVDTYYGKKLGIAPTTGGASNLAWKLGAKSQAELLADMKEGILVTGFLGGNSNGTTGDFSLGVAGFRVRDGKLAEPVSELNISANQMDFWKRLVAVGNDPYPYSSMRTPTLVFEGVQFAGV